jgi:hypothetical protein
MKKLFFIVVLGLALPNSNAQCKFGVRGGFNLSSLNYSSTNDGQVTSRFGLNGGFFAEIPLSSCFFIQPGISLVEKGCKYNEDLYEYEPDYGYGSYSYSAQIDFKLRYLELPVNFVGKFNITPSWHFLAIGGLYCGLGLDGKISGNAIVNGESSHVNRDLTFGSNDEEVKGFDYGVTLGTGLEFRNIQLTCQYEFGLHNISNTSEATVHTRSLLFSLAWLFKMNK